MYYATVVSFSFFWICTIFPCHVSGTNNMVEDRCDVIRDQFAVSASDFTRCSINNSRPITLCENCKDSYINMVNSYSNMSKKSGNETCLDRFINLDRLQIIQTQYLNNINLWNRGKCDECYLVKNGTATPTDQMTTFQNYYNSFNVCIHDTNSKTLCSHCMDKYVTLHDYYFTISNSNEKISFCIDLVDIMNTTMLYWSTHCCIYRQHKEYVFIGSAIGVFVLTVFFYIIVQFCSEKRVPTIIPQTRFAESISNLRN